MTETTYIREATVAYSGRRLKAERIASSRDAEKLVRKIIPEGSMSEHFVGIALDSKNRPIAYGIIAKGGMTYCAIDAGMVWRWALHAGAAGLIIAHNHPSGDSAPSPEDLAITERIIRGGKLLGVPVLDHLIVGDGECFSFLDSGLMESQQDCQIPGAKASK